MKRLGVVGMLMLSLAGCTTNTMPETLYGEFARVYVIAEQCRDEIGPETLGEFYHLAGRVKNTWQYDQGELDHQYVKAKRRYEYDKQDCQQLLVTMSQWRHELEDYDQQNTAAVENLRHQQRRLEAITQQNRQNRIQTTYCTESDITHSEICTTY
ncbi:hypothetical protein BZJ17_08720 [Salinivibrio sp. IB574]|uniref:hypothetical protein n=1 Tax=Salinivibrio sp. IB574 TaxID=1909444 RepID=UPI0009897627|nr:hypothetical protein [Salinivibrio sp. IB574]OOF21721.1 hypothetical protein BZJ17_08720 [Salinivibrio sp. IB574]